MFRTAPILVILAGVIPVAHAAVPALEHLHPAGAAIGSTQVVALTGKFDPWPTRFWVEGSGVTFSPTTNAARVEATISADAAPGPRWVRAWNTEGASEPRLFVVGSHPELPETEPNNTPAAPQSVEVGTLPVTINGRLDRNGDVDSFAVRVPAGQWIQARVDAYTLMSKVDAVLRLVTPQGAPLAWNHDAVALDPALAWRSAPSEEATVVVQVFGFKYPADASIQLTGGEGAVYRLHLSLHSDPPEGPAPEPPDETPAAYPFTARGALTTDRVENRHRIRGVRDDRIVLRVSTSMSPVPWDPRLRILDAAGKELAQNDDADGSPDPRLEWVVPGDGDYDVVVGSRIRRGNPLHRYELAVAKVRPDFRATVTAASFAVTAGTTNEVKVKLSRFHGHDRELRVGCQDLPEGVRCEPVTATAGMGEATLLWIAAPDAPAASRPVQVWVESPSEPDSTPRAVEMDLAATGENNGVPQGYSRLLRPSIDRLWLTVIPVADKEARP